MIVKDDSICIEDGEIVYINLYPYMSVNMRIVKLSKELWEALKDMSQSERPKSYLILSKYM